MAVFRDVIAILHNAVDVRCRAVEVSNAERLHHASIAIHSFLNTTFLHPLSEHIGLVYLSLRYEFLLNGGDHLLRHGVHERAVALLEHLVGVVGARRLLAIDCVGRIAGVVLADHDRLGFLCHIILLRCIRSRAKGGTHLGVVIQPGQRRGALRRQDRRIGRPLTRRVVEIGLPLFEVESIALGRARVAALGEFDLALRELVQRVLLVPLASDVGALGESIDERSNPNSEIRHDLGPCALEVMISVTHEWGISQRPASISLSRRL